MREQLIHRTVVQHLEFRAVPGCFWFHVGNGGYRRPIEGNIFKGLGVKAGIPDLILIRNGSVFGLELKADRGRLTRAQAAAHQQMRDAGVVVETAVGLDQALDILEGWALLVGKANVSPGDTHGREGDGHQQKKDIPVFAIPIEPSR
jgi:hypothetical protein